MQHHVDEGALFAALAKHPRHTAGVGSHPLPDRCRVEELFDWAAVASELGQLASKDVVDATFGPVSKKGGRPGLLQTRVLRNGRAALQDPAIRSRLGVLVIPDFVREDEEARILRDLRCQSNPEVVWGRREGGGFHASFGPTFLPESGYKVDSSKPFTALPAALETVKLRAEKLLASPSKNEAAFVNEMSQESGVVPSESWQEARRALAEWSMSPATRGGNQSPLSQAFLQRYESHWIACC